MIIMLVLIYAEFLYSFLRTTSAMYMAFNICLVSYCFYMYVYANSIKWSCKRFGCPERTSFCIIFQPATGSSPVVRDNLHPTELYVAVKLQKAHSALDIIDRIADIEQLSRCRFLKRGITFNILRLRLIYVLCDHMQSLNDINKSPNSEWVSERYKQNVLTRIEVNLIK